MVLTDWKKEIMGIRRAEEVSWQSLADKLGVTRQGVHGIIYNTQHIVPKSIVAVLDALGYDIEIEFVKKNKE